MHKSINRVSKRVLALLLSTIIDLSMLFVGGVIDAGAVVNAFEAGSKLYLKPNSDWLAADAKFAAYFFNSENGDTQKEWVEMSKVSDDSSAYEVTVPNTYSYDRVNFARFDSSASIAWNNQWNQTKAQGKAEGNICVITDNKDGNDYAPYWRNYIHLAASNTNVYFDNSITGWSPRSRTYLVAITDSDIYAAAFNDKVSNTDDLWRKTIATDFSNQGIDWSDVKSLAVICAPQTADALSTTAANEKTALFSDVQNEVIDSSKFKYSEIVSDSIITSTNNRLLIVPQSDGNGFSMSITNLGGTKTNDNSVMNLTQTVNIYTDLEPSSTGGSVYINNSDYFVMTGVAATNNNSANSYSSDSSGVMTFGAVHNTIATITAYANTDYHFVGWYSDSELTNQLSTENPYPYTVNGSGVLYAKFASGAPLPKYTQAATAYTVGGGEGGTAIVSAASVEEGSSVNFTAIPNPNYKFDGWFTTSDCSGSAESTDDPYTISSVSSDKTLYAKFSEFVVEDDSEDPTNETTPAAANKNTASRHINATSLSAQAQSYYTDEVKEYITSDNVYQSFVQLSQAEVNDASNSFDAIYKDSSGNYTLNPSDDKFKYEVQNSLFGALYNIMSSTHTHKVSYPAYGNNSLAHYWLTTDTSSDNENDGRGVYTFFYSDVDCFNHEDMQREHIWPKSKASYLMATGLGGSDLHHLRPAYGKVNNIKSNWGFASIHEDNSNSFKSGWKNKRTVYWPAIGANAKISLWRADDETTGTTFADYNTDVHGDIARILLYIYTRWKEPNLYSDIFNEDGGPDTTRLPELDPDDSKDTGERIIYDLPTLLKWMEEDPVSEWEMRRNDLTQDIQGNRNVFIDYPELAWLIFDETVPSDMDTPSGMAKHQNDYSYDIAKTEDVQITDPVTIALDTSTNNGVAEITAYDYTTKKTVYNGDTVSRGDVITYIIKPKESTIANIIEFSSDSNSSGNAYRHTIAQPDTSAEYSFSRQAGYYNGTANTGYGKERIRITLNSNACELILKSKSMTAAGTNAGGSGAGMISARYADGVNKNKVIATGDTVPNGTNVILTFTPDYGSRFVTASASSGVDTASLQQISGTDSYQVTVNLSCVKVTEKDGKTTTTYNSRQKTVTAAFAQTFNANDKVTDTGSVEYNKNQHIYNNGMRPDADDAWRDETDFTTNFEICGVQVKSDENNSNNKALRFISVIDKRILDKAESYGYVFGYTNHNLDAKTVNKYAYSVVYNPSSKATVDCTGTDNNIFGDYGKYSTNKNYKYITAVVNNIQNAGSIGLNTTIIARPYVKLKPEYVAEGAPTVIYGQYVDISTGENYCACSGSWNYINNLAG